MASLLNHRNRILLLFLFLNHLKAFALNKIQIRSECTFENDCTGDQPIFAHVVRELTLCCILKLFNVCFMKYIQIFRHGQRNIEKSYPNDPYKDVVYWPEGFGQLTNVSENKSNFFMFKFSICFEGWKTRSVCTRKIFTAKI